MIPLYGFLEGDTVGLVLLARPEQSMAELAADLAQAARVRVAPSAGRLVVQRDGLPLADSMTVAEAQLAPLDRFDVVRERDSPSGGRR